ncbi:hypothetical protein FKW77_002774 [Venturia effusa]|uniref:Uncharacterized protein n=1 Tax=Venturia effusa TaxID=50376 RepID=A0A517LDG0_9PEZI|nr:hypothetical protein FKW77_002774 [Venturia effusa]
MVTISTPSSINTTPKKDRRGSFSGSKTIRTTADIWITTGDDQVRVDGILGLGGKYQHSLPTSFSTSMMLAVLMPGLSVGTNLNPCPKNYDKPENAVEGILEANSYDLGIYTVHYGKSNRVVQ